MYLVLDKRTTHSIISKQASKQAILIDKKFIAKFLIVAILSRNSVFDRIPAFFI